MKKRKLLIKALVGRRRQLFSRRHHRIAEVDKDGYISLCDASQARLLKVIGRKPPMGTATRKGGIYQAGEESE